MICSEYITPKPQHICRCKNCILRRPDTVPWPVYVEETQKPVADINTLPENNRSSTAMYNNREPVEPITENYDDNRSIREHERERPIILVVVVNRPPEDPYQPGFRNSRRPLEDASQPGSRNGRRPLEDASEPGSRNGRRPPEDSYQPGSRNGRRPPEDSYHPGSRNDRRYREDPSQPGSRNGRRPPEDAYQRGYINSRRQLEDPYQRRSMNAGRFSNHNDFDQRNQYRRDNFDDYRDYKRGSNRLIRDRGCPCAPSYNRVRDDRDRRESRGRNVDEFYNPTSKQSVNGADRLSAMNNNCNCSSEEPKRLSSRSNQLPDATTDQNRASYRSNKSQQDSCACRRTAGMSDFRTVNVPICISKANCECCSSGHSQNNNQPCDCAEEIDCECCEPENNVCQCGCNMQCLEDKLKQLMPNSDCLCYFQDMSQMDKNKKKKKKSKFKRFDRFANPPIILERRCSCLNSCTHRCCYPMPVSSYTQDYCNPPSCCCCCW